MLYFILMVVLFVSSISCDPLIKLSENDSIPAEMTQFSNDTNFNDSNLSNEAVFEGRTLSMFSLHQIWLAYGEMKVAFLKLLIYKIRILIKLVSRIFGLQPYYSGPYQRGPYNMIQNQVINPNIMNPTDQYNQYIDPHQPNNYNQNYDYDINDLQFNLLPNDLSARSRHSLNIIIDWVLSLVKKFVKYIRI